MNETMTIINPAILAKAEARIAEDRYTEQCLSANICPYCGNGLTVRASATQIWCECRDLVCASGNIPPTRITGRLWWRETVPNYRRFDA